MLNHSLLLEVIDRGFVRDLCDIRGHFIDDLRVVGHIHVPRFVSYVLLN